MRAIDHNAQQALTPCRIVAIGLATEKVCIVDCQGRQITGAHAEHRALLRCWRMRCELQMPLRITGHAPQGFTGRKQHGLERLRPIGPGKGPWIAVLLQTIFPRHLGVVHPPGKPAGVAHGTVNNGPILNLWCQDRVARLCQRIEQTLTFGMRQKHTFGHAQLPCVVEDPVSSPSSVRRRLPNPN